MLYLKKINLEDADKEYEAIKQFLPNENGFENKYHDVSRSDFEEKVIPELINHSRGLDLAPGYVPETYFFLWDDDTIVGLFKLRHHLNDFLKKGAGHIGCGILPEYRGRGFATEGLKLTIEEARKIIPEKEIYMSVKKDNIASLRTQQNCGAYIAGETEDGTEYLTRIKL